MLEIAIICYLFSGIGCEALVSIINPKPGSIIARSVLRIDG
ncbi:hypothetical protein [Rivularia sp. PCC 7116]|nr:hypothetical protein [Rivularia sp. PCC 7116]